jgi:hypothetical protein
MKVRDSGTIILAVIVAFAGYYYSGQSVTSEDLEKAQDKVQTEYVIARKYAINLKEKYVNERDKCRENGEWKATSKCVAIKKVDSKAVRLWKKLKKLDKELKNANQKTNEVQDVIKKINTVKTLAVKVAQAVNA